MIMKNLYNYAKTNKREDILREYCEERNGMKIEDVPKSYQKKLWWECRKGHTYKMTAKQKIESVACSCPYCHSTPSLPEAIICNYIGKYFLTIPDYKPKFLNGREMDIYIPALRICIEYDGKKYHQNTEKDLEKNRICKEKGIDIIRIREKGCPPISGKHYTVENNFYEIIKTTTIILKGFGIKNPCLTKKELKKIEKKYQDMKKVV